MNLRDWIGRTETVTDTITATPYAALSATLDRSADRPADGHGAAAAVALAVFPAAAPAVRDRSRRPREARRLPAAGAAAAADVGRQPVRRSTRRCASAMRSRACRRIEDVTEKSGRTGTLVFVKVRHEIRRTGDTQTGADRVPRHRLSRCAEAGRSWCRRPQPAPADAAWSRNWVPDDVLLFRYSALTFNGHRIHYDRRYVTEVEGYPGLIVHGPLIATLLLDLLRHERPDAEVLRVSTSERSGRPSTSIRSSCAASRRRTARRSVCGAGTMRGA